MTWTLPPRSELSADGLVLRPLDYERDRHGLWDAARPDGGPDLFHFMLGTGPFDQQEPFDQYVKARSQRTDILPYVVFETSGRTLGSLTLIDCSAAHGSCEIGSVWLRRDVHGTGVLETCCLVLLSLMFDDLRYRRVVWKCDSNNVASNRSATSLGFRFEGTFRQHFWDKGRNRDTNWYSIVDGEWDQSRAVLLATRERKLSKRGSDDRGA